MESRDIPAAFAAWNIFPSTSMLTALVHSSSNAYFGLLKVDKEHYSRFWTVLPCTRLTERTTGSRELFLPDSCLLFTAGSWLETTQSFHALFR